jgi:hypothetical protein
MQDLCTACAEAGINVQYVGVRGSAATYASQHPRKPDHHFDKHGLGTSDMDVFFVTDQVLTCRPNTEHFFHPAKINAAYAPLEAWSEQWTQRLGRETTAGAFTSDASAMREAKITYTCTTKER